MSNIGAASLLAFHDQAISVWGIFVTVAMKTGPCCRYSFYDHIVCTRLLPINKAVITTKRLRHRNEHIDYGDGLQLTGSLATPKVMLP